MTALPPNSLAAAFSNYPSMMTHGPIGQPNPQMSLMTAPPSPNGANLQQLLALLAPTINPYAGPRGAMPTAAPRPGAPQMLPSPPIGQSTAGLQQLLQQLTQRVSQQPGAGDAALMPGGAANPLSMGQTNVGGDWV